MPGDRESPVDRPRRQALSRRRAGLILILVIAVAAPLGMIKPNPFHHPDKVHAIFDEAVGVSLVQRDVRVGGVRVGRIGDIKRRGDDADIELILDEDVGEIHADARASLRPHHPFEGTAFIDLDPGSESAPPLGDRPIPKSRTRIYVSLDQALRAFDRPTRAGFQTIIHELAPALGLGAPGIQRMLRNAPPLLRDGALVARALQGPQGDELRTIIPDLAATVDATAGRSGQLTAAVRGAQRMLAGLTVDATRPIDATLAELPSALNEARVTAAVAQRLTAKARRTTPLLTAAINEIRPVALESTPVLRRAQAAFVKLAPVLRNIEGALTNLGRAHPTATRVLAKLAAPARRLRTSVLPFLNEDSLLGQPTYMQLISGLSGLTGAMQAFQRPGEGIGGAGHVLRATADFGLALQGLPGTLPIPCSVIEQLNPAFTLAAKNSGLCTP